MNSNNVILVPIDNSVNAFKVTKHAIQIANVFQKSLYFVHILNEPMHVRLKHDQLDDRPSIEVLSEFYLKDCTNMALNCNVKHAFYSLIYGIPHKKIVEIANGKNIFFTIVGAHGSDDLYGNQLGHVAQYVSSWSKRAVTIIR